MHALRKNILIVVVTSAGIVGLLNVSVQFGKVLDMFPGISVSLLLAEELAETAGDEKATETQFIDLYLPREISALHACAASESVDACKHDVGIPAHPAFEKVTPPPKG